MPKYWVTNYFTHGRFPVVCQKQKTEEKKKTAENQLFFIKKNIGEKNFSLGSFPEVGQKQKTESW